MTPIVVSFAKASTAGMLLAYYPNNRTTVVLQDGFWFANGVALSADESFVAVCDSITFSVYRCVVRFKGGSRLRGPPTTRARWRRSQQAEWRDHLG